MAAKSKPNEIYICRIYDAPVKMVWDAWVDPQQVAQWWGPRGFTITTRKKDVKPGGIWDYTMHGPDGVNYENRTLYHEVEKHSRLVYDHGANEEQPPLFRVTVNFIDLGTKTKMEMTMALATAEAAKETKKFVKKAGGNSTWDRLAEYLEKETSQKEIFVINRTFEDSPEVLFNMFTKPELVTKWLPPGDFVMKYIECDIKTGGTAFYEMTSPTMKVSMFGKAFYKEVTHPTKIVSTQIFCDEKGNLARHPFAATWPESMLNTMVFTQEGENETRVTLTTEIDKSLPPNERDTFTNGRSGMAMGWTMSLDKLEELLNSH